jgi:DUF1680 family protein
MSPNSLQAADGAQFLDGIGETSLISRHIFADDLEDWSRNGLDASAGGGAPRFVEDETFTQVLSLPGGTDGTFVEIPTSGIGDAISLSITGWVRLARNEGSRWVFDLGSKQGPKLGLEFVPAIEKDGYTITLTAGATKIHASAASVQAGQWVHLSTVFDAAEKTASLYLDGKRIEQAKDVRLSLPALFDQSPTLLLGRSVAGRQPVLAGRLHDFRFYRSALNPRQIAAIHHNAISEEKITTVEADEESYREDRATLLHPGLERVADIQVSTEVGHLPRLPRQIAGFYKDGAAGPMVRVIWPAPTDNSSVAKTGEYKLTGEIPGTDIQAKATIRVVGPRGATAAPERGLTAFPLGEVLLNEDENGKPTKFIEHRGKFFDALAKSDPDRFLWVFRDAFDREQPNGARHLGGWETPETRVRGQASGHYLTALAQAYASASYDPDLQANFGRKMEYMITTLHEISRLSGKPAEEGGPANADPLQVPPGTGKATYDSNLTDEGIRRDYWNWGTGFISGYPPDQFIMLENGATYGGGNDQVWAPYYVLHKILTGLVDCYEVSGDPRALEMAVNMGLWVHKRLTALPPETLIRMWNSYIAGEYGGMNEILARLHRLTGDARFLEAAKLFDNTIFFFGDADRSHGLAKNVDTIRGRHSNQHIPQVLGALETYRNTRDPRYFAVAENFWDLCKHGYMYSIGGVAGARNPNNAECFTAEPNTLFANGLSEGGQNETCATYNLLKLGRELFMFERESTLMDYYERAIYNHILASVAENSSANTYHVPLNPGSRKSFGNPNMDSFSCCNCTAMESGTKLQDSIYFKAADDSAVYVNLFVPSTLDWKEKGMKLVQKTNFPYSDKTTLTVRGDGRLPIHLRIPSWTRDNVTLKVNGVAQEGTGRHGGYAMLDQEWKDGDTIEMILPMSFHLMPLMDQPNIASIFYGPVLLAAEEPEARSTWRRVSLDINRLEQSITGDPATLRFQTGDTKLKPFFDFYDGFHSVYLDMMIVAWPNLNY